MPQWPVVSPSKIMYLLVALLACVSIVVLIQGERAVSQETTQPTITRFQRAPTRTPTAPDERSTRSVPAVTSLPSATITRFLRHSTQTPDLNTATATSTTPAVSRSMPAAPTRFTRNRATLTIPTVQRFIRNVTSTPTVTPVLPATPTRTRTLIQPQISPLPKTEFAVGEDIIIIGTGNPGSLLRIWVNNVVVGTTSIDRDGVWGWRFQPERAGQYRISVVDTSPAVLMESERILLRVSGQ